MIENIETSHGGSIDGKKGQQWFALFTKRRFANEVSTGAK